MKKKVSLKKAMAPTAVLSPRKPHGRTSLQVHQIAKRKEESLRATKIAKAADEKP